MMYETFQFSTYQNCKYDSNICFISETFVGLLIKVSYKLIILALINQFTYFRRFFVRNVIFMVTSFSQRDHRFVEIFIKYYSTVLKEITQVLISIS